MKSFVHREIHRFLVATLCLAFLNGAAQSGDVPVNKQPIGALDSTEWVHSADVDGDGDDDLLTNSFTEGLDLWDSNGAQPPTFTRRPIDATFTASRSAMTADVDGDGDLDILAVAFNASKVVWWENNGARPPVWTKRPIADFVAAWSLYPADIDSDGDIDIAVASWYLGEIVWYESDGAKPPTWTRREVTAGLTEPRSVFVADIDQDGRLDILSASIGSDKVVGSIDWWQGNAAEPPAWTRHEINGNVEFAHEAQAVDLDQDGDLDVVGASYGSTDPLSWWESDGAQPPNWTRHLIDANLAPAKFQPADLDHDGDLDLVANTSNGDFVVFWENNGAAAPSWTKRVLGDGVNGLSITVADFDGDGDSDLATAGAADGLAWWENLIPGQVFFTGVIDGATSIPTITPGGVFQAFLRPGTLAASDVSTAIPLSQNLGISVMVDGRPSPLVGAFQAGVFDQVNGVASWDTPPDGRVTFTVVPGAKGGGAPLPYSVRVTPANPGMYTFQYGVGPAIVQNLSDFTFAQANGSLGGLSAHPAGRGDVIIVWSNGLGPINGTVPDGDVPGLDVPFLQPEKNVKLFIGGVEATIIATPVLHPTLVALFQINAIVGPNTPTGDRVPISIEVDCGDGKVFRSRRDVYIAVN